MTRQVYLVFYGDARWDATERRAGSRGGRTPTRAEVACARRGRARRHHAPSRTSRRGSMTFPLVALAVLSIVGGLINLPFIEPAARLPRHLAGAVVRGRAARCTSRRSRSGSCSSTVALDHRASSASWSAARCTGTVCPRRVTIRSAQRLGPVRQGARERVLLRRRHRPLRQRPGHRRRPGSSATASTARSSTARSTASAPGSSAAGGGLRKRADRARAQLRARHRARRGAARRLHVRRGRWRDGRLPDPHRARSCCRPSARCSRCSRPSSRPELARAVGYVDERRDARPRASTCWSSSTRGDAGLPVRRRATPGWSRSASAGRVGVDGISLFMVVLTALLIPIGLLASAEHRAGQVVHRAGCCCSRRALIGVFLALDLVAVLRVLRGRARADVLPHRGLGPRATAATRR